MTCVAVCMSVRLSHYDPRWPQEFEQLRSSLFFGGEGWISAVHHVGSTALSGLIARPTIDAIAVTEDVEAQAEAVDLIEGLNFRRIPPPMWAADAIYLCKPRHLSAGEVATHEMMVVVEGSLTLRRSLLVRDHLREDREAAIRFEETKVARWRGGDGDPERYAADKAVFFAHLEDQAGL